MKNDTDRKGRRGVRRVARASTAANVTGDLIHLSRNRRHTQAEVELVMAVFDCNEQYAREVLKSRLPPEKFAVVHGMLDAAWLEIQEAKGRKFSVPSWLQN